MLAVAACLDDRAGRRFVAADSLAVVQLPRLCAFFGRPVVIQHLGLMLRDRTATDAEKSAPDVVDDRLGLRVRRQVVENMPAFYIGVKVGTQIGTQTTV